MSYKIWGISRIYILWEFKFYFKFKVPLQKQSSFEEIIWYVFLRAFSKTYRRSDFKFRERGE